MLVLSFVLFFLTHPGWSFQHLISRYWEWLIEVVTNGNFGWSWTFRMPVSEIIGRRLPNTLRLLFVTLLIIYGIGIPLGIISGKNPNSLRDRIILIGTQISASFPVFTMGYVLMLYLVFGVMFGFRWFPLSGSIPLGVYREAGFI